MKKRFERFLSSLLLLTILLLLIEPILANFKIDQDLLSYIWDFSLLSSWILMLVYGLYILMEKDTRSFSIFVALITTVGFIILTYYAIIVSGKYIAIIPDYIAVGERLVGIGQEVFYTALIIVYVLHILNLILLRKYETYKKM